jgi:hypothetical protein
MSFGTIRVKIEGLLNTESSPACTTAELKIVVFAPVANRDPSVAVCALITGEEVLLQAITRSRLRQTTRYFNRVFTKGLFIIIQTQKIVIKALKG